MLEVLNFLVSAVGGVFFVSLLRPRGAPAPVPQRMVGIEFEWHQQEPRMLEFVQM